MNLFFLNFTICQYVCLPYSVDVGCVQHDAVLPKAAGILEKVVGFRVLSEIFWNRVTLGTLVTPYESSEKQRR